MDSILGVGWLLMLGLSLDGVGAILIAWPLLRSPPESQELAIQRWGGNPWLGVTRSRETRFVQFGAIFLASGFVLQAVGHIVRFGSPKAAAVLSIAGTVAIGLFGGVKVANRGLPKYITPEETAVEDQRHVYRIATVSDYRKLLGTYVFERHRRLPIRLTERAPARIDSGRWRASCPACGPNAIVSAWPDNLEAICSEGGHLFDVDFPPKSERDRIVQALERRLRENRHWSPDKSAEDIENENRINRID